MGIRSALEEGVIAGYPLTDIKVILLDGSYHEVDSALMDFEICGSMAVKEAIRKGAFHDGGESSTRPRREMHLSSFGLGSLGTTATL